MAPARPRHVSLVAIGSKLLAAAQPDKRWEMGREAPDKVLKLAQLITGQRAGDNRAVKQPAGTTMPVPLRTLLLPGPCGTVPARLWAWGSVRRASLVR